MTKHIPVCKNMTGNREQDAEEESSASVRGRPPDLIFPSAPGSLSVSCHLCPYSLILTSTPGPNPLPGLVLIPVPAPVPVWFELWSQFRFLFPVLLPVSSSVPSSVSCSRSQFRSITVPFHHSSAPSRSVPGSIVCPCGSGSYYIVSA